MADAAEGADVRMALRHPILKYLISARALAVQRF
jgi:hypothetical protein